MGVARGDAAADGLADGREVVRVGRGVGRGVARPVGRGALVRSGAGVPGTTIVAPAPESPKRRIG